MRVGSYKALLAVVFIISVTSFVWAQAFEPSGEGISAGDRGAAVRAIGSASALGLPGEALQPVADPEANARALEIFDLSPAIFVENRGQWDESIRYGFNGKGINVLFTDEGPVFQLMQSGEEDEDV